MLFKVHYRYVITDLFKKAMVSSCHDPTRGIFRWQGEKVVTNVAKSSALRELHEVTTGWS